MPTPVPTLRFAAGTHTRPGIPAPPLRPRFADRVNAGDLGIWSVGYPPADLAHATAQPRNGRSGSVIAVGPCLAVPGELHAAASAAADGAWTPAAELPGAALTVVRCPQYTVVAGDLAGTVLVYFTRRGDTVYWASTATPLAALDPRARPQLRLLAADLALTGVDVLGTRSIIGDVERVPPDRVLVLSPDGEAHTMPRRLSRAPSGFGEAAAALRDALTVAVGRRAAAAKVPTCDLSGGLDSSTVACLAAGHPGSGPLHAVTYTDATLKDSDDLAYAARIAAAVPGLTHTVIDTTTADAAHFDGLTAGALLPVTDAPALALGLLAVKDAQFTPMTQAGSTMHLTGRGGDNAVGGYPAHLVDQARARQPLAATAAARQTARARHLGVRPMLTALTAAATTSYPAQLAALERRLRTQRPARPPAEPHRLLDWCGPSPAAHWLTTRGRREVADTAGWAAAQAEHPDTAPHHGLDAHGPGEVRDWLGVRFMAQSHASFTQIAHQRWGLEIHAPFLDAPVIRAGLAAPGWERARPGTYKPLLATAMAGLVPDFLLHRGTKTDFTASTHTGWRRNAAHLRRILAGSTLVADGLLGPAAVSADLDHALGGGRAPRGALHTLIATELWLRRLDLRLDTWWEPRNRPETATTPSPMAAATKANTCR